MFISTVYFRKDIMKIRKFVRSILNHKINILLTIYINLKLFPLNIAIKFPIYVYGKWRFFDLSGKIEFTVPIRRGILLLGKNLAGFCVTGKGSLRISENAKIIVGDNVIISQGNQICIKNGAILKLNNNVKLGDFVRIICAKFIEIGAQTDITYESQVTDFNSHFIENLNTKKISTIYKPVWIGEYCWIGNRTTIMPGTILPDRTIVCSNSLLNKNYKIQGLQMYSLIGGIPAKLINTGLKRIYNTSMEKELCIYFINNEVDNVDSENFINL